jgi:hypothetical protein
LKLFSNSYSVYFPFQENLIRDFTSEFDFTGQPNISIYYKVLILNVAAFLLFLIAYFKGVSKDPFRFHWRALAWLTWFISIDSLAMVNKKIVEYLQDGAQAPDLVPGKWMIAGVVAALILVVLFLRFWRQLDSTYRILLPVSVAMYFGGVLVKENSLFTYTALAQTLQYGGISLLIYTLLHYMKTHVSPFSVSTNY